MSQMYKTHSFGICHKFVLFNSTYFFVFSYFSNKKKALLETSEPIIFSKTVQPICISSTYNAKNKTYANEAAFISGWGNLMEEFAIGNNIFFDQIDFYTLGIRNRQGRHEIHS